MVDADGTCLLLDCGFSAREACVRLGRLGISPEQLTAIVVTHEHGDHVRGVGALARKYALAVWASHGTCCRHLEGDLPNLNVVNGHDTCAIGGLYLEPFPVPHDAREPLQFVFGDGVHRLGVLTDTGHVTAHIERMLVGLDALILEANHDTDMLADGPYPPALKQRVGGRLGHLSNTQAATAITRLDSGRWQHLVAAHVSDKNNSRPRVVQALSGALGCEPHWIQVAPQDGVLSWREIKQ